MKAWLILPPPRLFQGTHVVRKPLKHYWLLFKRLNNYAKEKLERWENINVTLAKMFYPDSPAILCVTYSQLVTELKPPHLRFLDFFLSTGCRQKYFDIKWLGGSPGLQASLDYDPTRHRLKAGCHLIWYISTTGREILKKMRRARWGPYLEIRFKYVNEPRVLKYIGSGRETYESTDRP